MKRLSGLLTFFVMAGILMIVGTIIAIALLLDDAPVVPQGSAPLQQQATASPMPTATETIPPYTPLPSLTPSQTLLPPPTFEPPTLTPPPSATPTVTLTATYAVDIDIPGLHGAESATPSTTPGCEPRDDWGLTYTIQADDALSRIADQYGVYASDLAAGNCITDANVISIGQVIRVPGDAHPSEPQYVCVAWEALTPFNGSQTVIGSGNITFNWRGVVAPKYLIRITRPDGSQYEQTVELRMNDTVDVATNLPQEGHYTWQIFPLDENFVQIPCPESPAWSFYKESGPTATPQPAPMANFMNSGQSGSAPFTVEFFNTSSGEITGYHWDFGDGTTSTEASPTHTYNAAGTYFVTLTAYGPDDSATSNTMITVQ